MGDTRRKAEGTLMLESDCADHNRRVARYYDAIQQDFLLVWTNTQALALHFGYWDATTGSHFEAQTNLNRILAERAALRPGQRILDAGCGIGGSALWLTQQYRVYVLGITLSPVQARRARTYAVRRRLTDRAAFALQDYTTMAVGDGTVDVVWALESVCHASNKRAFLAEAFRILRPGGRLVMADGFRRARPFSVADEQLLQAWLSGWAIPDIDTPEEFVTAMCDVGFADTQFDEVTDRILPSMQRLDRLARAIIPPARLLSRAGLLSPIRFRNGEASAACCEALRRGLTLYGLISAMKR
jgi:cyclopropane fatty-acyl-phospholipid synthase-like methyltransferase